MQTAAFGMVAHAVTDGRILDRTTGIRKCKPIEHEMHVSIEQCAVPAGSSAEFGSTICADREEP
jgi:hypothetical protein